MPQHRSATDTLRESFFKPSGMTMRQLAAILGVSPTYVADILAGRRGISIQIALALELKFDPPAEYWMNLQLRDDLGRVRAEQEANRCRTAVPSERVAADATEFLDPSSPHMRPQADVG